MKNELRYFEVISGEGLYTIKASVTLCGSDLNLCCGGGDTFHIGACALAVPRPSLSDPQIVSASASVICVTGHKDDEIAKEAALRLASKFNAHVSVATGLHIDDATKEDIAQLYQNYLLLIDKVEKLVEEIYWSKR